MKTPDTAEELYKRLSNLVGEEQDGLRFQNFLENETNSIEHIVTEKSELWNYYFSKIGICVIVLKRRVFSIAMYINKNEANTGEIYKGYLPMQITPCSTASDVKLKFGREPEVTFADGRFGFKLSPLVLLFSFDQEGEQLKAIWLSAETSLP